MSAVQLHHTAISEVTQPKGYLSSCFLNHPSTQQAKLRQVLSPNSHNFFTFKSLSVKMHQGATNVRGGGGGLALLQTTTRPAGEHEILLDYTKIQYCLLNPLSSKLSDK